MKNFLIILTVTTFLACRNSDDMNEIKYAFCFDANLDFSVYNAQNEDLLNPENPNHLDTSNFKVFYVINVVKV